MSIKEQVVEGLNALSEADLKEVAEYLEFLKFRARRVSPTFDESQLSQLYSEFADEDSRMAEEGMADYSEGLLQEDAR